MRTFGALVLRSSSSWILARDGRHCPLETPSLSHHVGAPQPRARASSQPPDGCIYIFPALARPDGCSARLAQACVVERVGPSDRLEPRARPLSGCSWCLISKLFLCLDTGRIGRQRLSAIQNDRCGHQFVVDWTRVGDRTIARQSRQCWCRRLFCTTHAGSWCALRARFAARRTAP
eukprot:1076327-Pleurochrysis_carterae.AAC.1